MFELYKKSSMWFTLLAVMESHVFDAEQNIGYS